MTTTRVFIIVLGIIFFLVSPSSAVPTDNIKLNAEKIAVDAGSQLLIPCHYSMNSHFQNKHLELEWGMIPEQGGSYTPVYMPFDNNKEPLQQPNPRAHALLSRHKGDCSLVISPAQIEDSGTYQIHLLVNGERFSPTTTVKVHVKTCIESYGADLCTCDEVQVQKKAGLDEKTIIIIAGCVAGGLLLLALIGCCIGVLVYCRKNEKDELMVIEEGSG